MWEPVQAETKRTGSRGMSRFTRAQQLLDVRSGVIGGSFLAAVVWGINASHGALPATTAALKQFVYTFFMGALIMRFCTRIALRSGPPSLRLALATLLPSLVTVSATYAVHSLRGTPEPLLSTLPAAILSPPSFAIWAWRVQRTGRTLWERAERSAGRGANNR